MNDIQSIVQSIGKLRPMAPVVHKVMSVYEETNGDLVQLAQVISTDAALTANLLRGANSAYYGRSRRVETVREAVVFLGASEVMDLVLIAASAGHMNKTQAGYDLGQGQLWRYSLMSAFLAKSVAEQAGTENRQLVFTAGLLKDIGKVVLSQYVSDRSQQICRLVAEEGMSFREAEKAVLGIDHAELGAMVARVWQFSPKLIEVIQNHHQPQQSKVSARETAAVYMGDILCMMLGVGGGADGLAYHFHRHVVDQLGLSSDRIQLIMAEVAEKMAQMEAGLMGA